MEFMEVIKNRRSVRKFKSDPVPDEILTEILEAGRYAPSGGHAAGDQKWIATAPVVIAYCTYVGFDLAQVAEGL